MKEDADKARTLSDFFSSVFIREETTEMLEMDDEIIRQALTEIKV